MKKCPYCAEQIQDEAIVCRYCGRDLPATSAPVAEAKQEKIVQGQVSVWRQGAKGSAVITVLYAIATFFNAPNPAELAGSLTVGLITTFLFWWLICSGFVWGWRKLGSNTAAKILFVIGFVIAVSLLTALVSGGGDARFPAPTGTPTHMPNPTSTPSFDSSTGCPSGETPATLENIGSKPLSAFGDRCFIGIVSSIEQDTNNNRFTVFFSDEPSSFYVTVTNVDYPISIGSCVVVSGNVLYDVQGTPYMDLYGSALRICP